MRISGFLAVVLALTLLLPARADVRGATGRIDDALTLRSVDALASSPLKLSTQLTADDELLVFFRCGVARVEVRVLARPSADARALAVALEGAVAGTPLQNEPVLYSRSSRWSAALALWRRPQPGAVDGESAAAVGTVVERLRAAGYRPRVALYVPGYLTGPPPALPRDRAWFDASAVPADFAPRARVHLTGGALVRAALFLFGPGLVGGLGLLAGLWVARQERIPKDRRRGLYLKLVRWPALGAIGVHAPFALYYLRSDEPRALADLWFATFRPSEALGPWLLGAPLLMLALVPLGIAQERKLFGSETPAAPPQAPPMTDEEARVRGRELLWSLAPLGVAAWSVLFLQGRLSSESPLRSALPLVFIGVVFLGNRLVRAAFARQLAAWDAGSESAALTERLATLGGGATPPVRVLERGWRSVRLRLEKGPGGAIVVSRRLVDLLTPEQLDFVLAHELGHRRRRHGLWRGAANAALLVALAGPFALNNVTLAEPARSVVLALPIVAGVALIVGGGWLRGWCERDADRFALSVTGDADAAETAIGALVATEVGSDSLEVWAVESRRKARVAALRHGLR